jgi:hypothetical protein
MSRTLAVLAAVAVISLGLAGCTTPGPSSTRITAAPKTDASTSSTHATTMLNSIILPSGTQRVVRLTQPGFGQPEQRPACQPLIDQPRYWTVRSTVGQVGSFLNTHPEMGMRISASGVFNGTKDSGDFVAEAPINQSVRSLSSQSTLVVTFISVGNGDVGIRADAEVVPKGARCQTSGGGAASSSGGAAAP